MINHLKTIIIISLILVSCSSKTNTNTVSYSSTDSVNLPPVETESPNSNYKPAFEGQTRISGVRTVTPYQVKVLTTNLNSPWGIAMLPDGRFLITEKKGTMRIAATDGKLSEPITGIPAVNPEGQGGLLGITIDKNFATNRIVYWVFSERTTTANATSVAKGSLSVDERSIENAKQIYRAEPAYNGTLHYGGRIVQDSSGNLFVSTGERSDLETRPQAEFINSALGKILHITPEGKPAPGNPFSGRPDAKGEVFSYGHRNVQGLAIHPVTRDLWNSEMGPRGGDEINIINAGKNYGWPIIGYGIEYSGKKVGEGITQKEGMEQPVYYWDPVISPSGITFYKSGIIPEWKNNLFVCGLSGNHIARLVITNNKVVGEERLLSDQNQRFRDITEGKDGALYAITDQGRLYRIGKNQ